MDSLCCLRSGRTHSPQTAQPTRLNVASAAKLGKPAQTLDTAIGQRYSGIVTDSRLVRRAGPEAKVQPKEVPMPKSPQHRVVISNMVCRL